MRRPRAVVRTDGHGRAWVEVDGKTLEQVLADGRALCAGCGGVVLQLRVEVGEDAERMFVECRACGGQRFRAPIHVRGHDATIELNLDGGTDITGAYVQALAAIDGQR